MAVEPLSPTDLVAHRYAPGDPAAPQPYEWWYFEFHFRGAAHGPDGEVLPLSASVDDWVVVLSCHAPHFFDPLRLLDVTMARNERGEHPGEQVYPPDAWKGTALSIYRIPPTVPLIDTLVGFSATRTPDGTTSDDPARPFEARWGSEANPIVTVRVDASGDLVMEARIEGWWAEPGLVQAKFAGRKARRMVTTLSLRWQRRSQGFRLGDGTLMCDQWGGRHHWALHYPDARVTGRIHVEAEGRVVLDVPALDTIGYHDHQWGPNLPLVAMNEWSWGRALVRDTDAVDPDLLVFFRAEPMRDQPTPGIEPWGIDACVRVRSGAGAVEWTSLDGQDVVLRRGWDPINYPLPGFDPVPATWTSGRALGDVAAALRSGKGTPAGEPPSWVPPDDTAPSLLQGLAMLLGRPLARWQLEGKVGYWSVIDCRGDERGVPQQWLTMQRGACVEPWPFYHRYVGQAAVSSLPDGARHELVDFALSEFLEVHELLQGTRINLGGHPVVLGLLGVSIFCELMTWSEPGAPRLWPVLLRWRR